MQTKLRKTPDLSRFLSNGELTSKISAAEKPLIDTVKDNKIELTDEEYAKLSSADPKDFEYPWQALNHR